MSEPKPDLETVDGRRAYVVATFADPFTGTLHPIGEARVSGCGCKNCDPNWTRVRPAKDGP